VVCESLQKWRITHDHVTEGGTKFLHRVDDLVRIRPRGFEDRRVRERNRYVHPGGPGAERKRIEYEHPIVPAYAAAIAQAHHLAGNAPLDRAAHPARRLPAAAR